jgi:hypothetical protein
MTLKERRVDEEDSGSAKFRRRQLGDDALQPCGRIGDVSTAPSKASAIEIRRLELMVEEFTMSSGDLSSFRRLWDLYAFNPTQSTPMALD